MPAACTSNPWQEIDNMGTRVDTAPLFSGRFGSIHDKCYGINPHYGPNSYRYRHYNACFFASLCRQVPGDFVIAGISYGATAKVLYDFLDFASLGKTLHLVDPLEGTTASGVVAANYNRDPGCHAVVPARCASQWPARTASRRPARRPSPANSKTILHPGP